MNVPLLVSTVAVYVLAGSMQVAGAAAKVWVFGEVPSAAGHGVGTAVVPGGGVVVVGASEVAEAATVSLLPLSWLNNQIPKATTSAAATMPPQITAVLRRFCCACCL